MKGAGGASDPTRRAPTSIPASGNAARIASVLRSAVLDGDAPTVTFVRKELARHRVSLEGLPSEAAGLFARSGRGGDSGRHCQGRSKEPAP